MRKLAAVIIWSVACCGMENNGRLGNAAEELFAWKKATAVTHSGSVSVVHGSVESELAAGVQGLQLPDEEGEERPQAGGAACGTLPAKIALEKEKDVQLSQTVPKTITLEQACDMFSADNVERQWILEDKRPLFTQIWLAGKGLQLSR